LRKDPYQGIASQLAEKIRFVSGHRFSDATKGHKSERLQPGLARRSTAAKAGALYGSWRPA
jgi:hypothetical protein